MITVDYVSVLDVITASLVEFTWQTIYQLHAISVW